MGVKKGTPVFKDGETPYETNTIRYNFKSKKGIISNVVSQMCIRDRFDRLVKI